MRKALVFGILFIVFSIDASAQWRWGKRGGSETHFGNGLWETVYDITTDNNGNIYALCRADGVGRDIDGHDLQGYGDYDIIITSFDCAGNYRWSKVIGSNDHQDLGVAIKTDDEGNVYACGEIYMFNDNYIGHIDSDSTLSGTRKSLFIVKYGSDGTFKWLQMPQPDTVSATSFTRNKYFDMDVEPGGNIHILTMLSDGNYHGSYIVDELSLHIMHYDSDGNFLNATPFEMNVTQLPSRLPKMAYETNTQRYYIAGTKPTDSISIGGAAQTGNGYIAAFNNAGEHLWTVQSSTGAGGNGSGASGFDSRPVIDETGNIYVAGRTFDNDVFAGTTITNSVTSLPNNIPLVVKLNPNGDVIWAKSASAYEGRGITLSLRGSDELMFAGYYEGKLRWDGYTAVQPTHVLNQEEDIFITTMNRNTGDVLMLDTIGSDFGSHDFVTCMATDVFGNAILGGRFENEMYVGDADTLSMEGKTSDLFVIKYGAASCWPANVTSEAVNNELKVYPNPAFSELTISSGKIISSVTIYDVLGKIVLEKMVNSEQCTLDISKLISGLYFVQINDEVVRFVKE